MPQKGRKNILVCGSLAFDDIGFFDQRLTAATRNVKLTRLFRGFGGCAINIAYNLKTLGDEPFPFAYAGEDFAPEYEAHLKQLEISDKGIQKISDSVSSRGIVLTDNQGEQFTAFYPGPSMQDDYAQALKKMTRATCFDAVVIAPDEPVKMLTAACELGQIPIRLWCPGQYAELLDLAQIEVLVEFATLLIVNAHEWRSLCHQSDAAKLRTLVDTLIITDGPHPITVHRRDGSGQIQVPPISQSLQVDPTGCGDAFAAAYLHHALADQSPSDSVKMAVEQAARCMAKQGCQNH